MNVFVFCVSSSKFQNMHSVVVFLYLENDGIGYKVRFYNFTIYCIKGFK